jgi:hypothetical protein
MKSKEQIHLESIYQKKILKENDEMHGLENDLHQENNWAKETLHKIHAIIMDHEKNSHANTPSQIIRKIQDLFKDDEEIDEPIKDDPEELLNAFKRHNQYNIQDEIDPPNRGM